MAATTLRERFEQEMVVRGLAERTRRAYLLNVTLLHERTGKHPARMTADDLREYFTWMVEEHHAAPATVRQNLCAVSLFLETVLGRKEEFFEHARPRHKKKLPVVLSFEETRRTLAAIRVPRLRTAATFTYSCGLRAGEAVAAAISWINADAHSLHVHDGKGGVDRIVPLPEPTVHLLREHWRRERPRGDLLFESAHHRTRAGRPMSKDVLRQAVKAAATEAGVHRPVCLHSLRHSYASHLLERGVPLPLIQKWLGHKSMQTTRVYVHVTPVSLERARAVVAELVQAL